MGGVFGYYRFVLFSQIAFCFKFRICLRTLILLSDRYIYYVSLLYYADTKNYYVSKASAVEIIKINMNHEDKLIY